MTLPILQNFTRKQIHILIAVIAAVAAFAILMMGVGIYMLLANPGRPAQPGVIQFTDPPEGTARNDTWSVFVRTQEEKEWRELFPYNVKVGHQEGDPYSPEGERVDATMVAFDFTGTVDMKVTYNGGNIETWDLRPTSYGIPAEKVGGDTLTFSVTQDETSPRKMVLRINDNWYDLCLHIVTNPLETDAPNPEADNVLVIQPGETAPLYLPEGKDTYYFAPGTHTLPRGLWVELDLGEVKKLTSFKLQQGETKENYFMNGQQSFLLEGKKTADAEYTVMYDGRDNEHDGVVSGTFPAFEAQYVRLTLLGNNNLGTETTGNYHVFASYMKELRLYETEGGENVAMDKAVRGAMEGWEKATDADDFTAYTSQQLYGNWHAGESFFLSQDNTTVYLAPGSVVKGSFLADGMDNITIKGRGILDCSDNVHSRPLAEARTGAIWLSSGENQRVEGITILDPPMWGVVINYCDTVMVKNINFFGSVTNADGIHFSATSNGTVDGCFIRTCDDQFVMYHYGEGSHNTVKNSVIWGDGARTFLLGLGGSTTATISDITIENIDVLNQQGVWDLTKHTSVFWIWACTDNPIKDVLIRNVRIDSFREPSASGLFFIRNDTNDDPYVNWQGGGPVSGITLENIRYNGDGELKSVIKGRSEENNVSNIRFIDFYKNETPLTEENQADFFEKFDYVSDIEFEVTTKEDAS